MTAMDPRIKQLTDYASALRFAGLPAEAVHECKRKIIDSIGCAFGAFDEEASKIVRAIARRYSGKPPARIFGTLEETSVEYFKGHVKNPLTDEEVEAKFRRQVAGRMADRAIDPLLEKLWKLEDVANIKEVIDLLIAQTRC